MIISRRRVLFTSVGLALTATNTHARSEILPRMPDPDRFQSGDFLWPKKPGAFVPYNSGSEEDVIDDRRRWLFERDRLLSQARAGTIPNAHAIKTRLENLTYDAFQHEYLTAQQPEQFTTYAGGTAISVGHVGIVQIDSSGTPFVIEALFRPGVTKQSFSEWQRQRPGEIAWHGRLKYRSAEDRTRLAMEAAKYIGRPYNFWSFNLNDDTGFYCSKLVWLSVFRSLNIAVDGNITPLRIFWLSPKQLLYSKFVHLLHDPGEYATK